MLRAEQGPGVGPGVRREPDVPSHDRDAPEQTVGPVRRPPEPEPEAGPAFGVGGAEPEPRAGPACEAGCGEGSRRRSASGGGTSAAVEEELARYYARGWAVGAEGLTGTASWEERLARVALTRVADPGDEVMGRAVRERGAPAALAAATAGAPLPGASPRRTAGYAQRAQRAERADPVADLAQALRVGARFVCPGDGDWPGQLDDLGDQRPYGLWVRGEPSLRLWALRSVAVVGARACTDYGAHMAARIGAGLADAGWVVVSGAAYGVDGTVHRAALAAPGATIGVVASGIDVPYPRGNTALIRDIAERGLLIGELAPAEHPTRSRCVNCTIVTPVGAR